MSRNHPIAHELTYHILQPSPLPFFFVVFCHHLNTEMRNQPKRIEEQMASCCFQSLRFSLQMIFHHQVFDSVLFLERFQRLGRKTPNRIVHGQKRLECLTVPVKRRRPVHTITEGSRKTSWGRPKFLWPRGWNFGSPGRWPFIPAPE